MAEDKLAKILDWSPAEVQIWLRQNGHADVSDIFYQNNIDGSDLIGLDRRYLKKMGLTSYLQMNDILKRVEKLLWHREKKDRSPQMDFFAELEKLIHSSEKQN